jgi:hypothetical protein
MRLMPWYSRPGQCSRVAKLMAIHRAPEPSPITSRAANQAGRPTPSTKPRLPSASSASAPASTTVGRRRMPEPARE